ncbi:MAG TPA: copper homeostasis protein CutC [Rhodanobacteraceae bacterium]
MTRRILEVAANSVASALTAEAGGADRVELCCALEVGGLTPSSAAITVATERLHIPIHVLIRPRSGDFVFDDLECKVMCHDIEACGLLGCAGVVIGALDADGNIDQPHCREFIRAAGTMAVTFHRAFDFSNDPLAALETVIDLGYSRLLTSGQAADALAGSLVIRGLIERAHGRISVMPGGGINAGNIAAIARGTGARELHTSAKVHTAGRMHQPPSRIGEMDAGYWQTDVNEVRARVEALEALP